MSASATSCGKVTVKVILGFCNWCTISEIFASLESIWVVITHLRAEVILMNTQKGVFLQHAADVQVSNHSHLGLVRHSQGLVVRPLPSVLNNGYEVVRSPWKLVSMHNSISQLRPVPVRASFHSRIFFVAVSSNSFVLQIVNSTNRRRTEGRSTLKSSQQLWKISTIVYYLCLQSFPLWLRNKLGDARFGNL